MAVRQRRADEFRDRICAEVRPNGTADLGRIELL
jgi:hypothetical protein